jgi:hypothetical protein
MCFDGTGSVGLLKGGLGSDLRERGCIYNA